MGSEHQRTKTAPTVVVVSAMALSTPSYTRLTQHRTAEETSTGEQVQGVVRRCGDNQRAASPPRKQALHCCAGDDLSPGLHAVPEVARFGH